MTTDNQVYDAVVKDLEYGALEYCERIASTHGPLSAQYERVAQLLRERQAIADTARLCGAFDTDGKNWM
jgi:hypothetical protein